MHTLRVTVTELIN